MIKKESRLDCYCQKNNNTKVFFSISLSLITDHKKKPIYFLVLFYDLTEINQKKAEILSQNAKLKAVFQSQSHCIWTVNRKYEVTSHNTNFEALMQTNNKEALVFSGDKYVFSKKAPGFHVWNKKYRQAFKGKSQHFEFNLSGDDNLLLWQEIFLEPIINEEKKTEEVFGIAHDISEKKKNELQIQQALKEKEVLLKEVHHRVKNNMQIINSILSLQSGFVRDQKTISILKECQNRIKSMALIHENLYLFKNFSKIKVDDYLSAIATSLLHSYQPPDKKIKLILNLEPLFIDVDYSIPCGLIVNELISNSIKHAFSGKTNGEIEISIKKNKTNILLSVKDNGISLNRDFNKAQTLGLQLVSALVEQINASIKINKVNGTAFLIKFTYIK